MLAEAAVRRAEEIEHLTEASGFLFQQIKSILLKVEGRKEKRSQAMPEKNLFALSGPGNCSRALHFCKATAATVSGSVRLGKGPPQQVCSADSPPSPLPALITKLTRSVMALEKEW